MVHRRNEVTIYIRLLKSVYVRRAWRNQDRWPGRRCRRTNGEDNGMNELIIRYQFWPRYGCKRACTIKIKPTKNNILVVGNFCKNLFHEILKTIENTLEKTFVLTLSQSCDIPEEPVAAYFKLFGSCHVEYVAITYVP